MMTPYIEWNRSERAEFHSLQELEQLIEQLTIRAVENNMPLSIGINLNAETGLLITVGREESHMEFYSETGGPLIVVSRGPWDSDERFETTYMGESSSLEKRYCVPITYAREAVRRYFLTGTRPDNITWEV